MIDRMQEAWAELTAPGGGFSMSEITVRGVTMRVYDSAPPNMRAIWELATLQGDKTYLVYEDERYSYAEIAAQVRVLAHVLRERHGVGSGDRVALAMRNYPEWVVGYWATVVVGAAAVGMNAWWTTPEMEFGLADSRPKVLIADDERLARVFPVLDALRSGAPLHLISVRSERELPDDASRWADVVDPAAAPEALPDARIDPDDDVTVFYTSGTTGFPKGAQLTHRGSVHNILNIVFSTMVTAAADAKAVAAGELSAPSVPSAPVAPVALGPTPLFHVTACNCVLHPMTLAGGTVVFMHKWNVARAIELIERERVTVFSGVPTMSREMLAHPDWSRRDTSSLKSLGGGGAPLQPDLVDKIDRSLRKDGGVPTTGYGLTETTGIISANSARYYLAKPESCGRVVPCLDAKLVADDGRDLEPGPDVVGQLCVRGPLVVKGYLNQPEATADAIRAGWFNTGDIARIDDDGYLYIVDRAKDMVLRGGENVYCSEVEAAIYQHDAIAEAAVFGVPDDRLGESVAAVIVLRDGVELEAHELQAFLDGRIAKHKIPAHVWFRDDPLPRNANGKFLKREVRADVLAATSDA